MVEEVKKNKSKKKSIALMVGLIVLLLLVAGTFLWFTAKGSISNIFNMDTFKVVITEDFDPNEPVVPGAEIDKDVKVENQGDAPVAVRIKIHEEVQHLAMNPITNEPVVEYASSKHTDDENYIAVRMSDAQVLNLSKSGYKQLTQNVPTGFKVWVLNENKVDGTGISVKYVACTDDTIQQAAKYDPDAKTCEYAYYKKGDLKTGIHGMTNDIDHTSIKLSPTDTELQTNWIFDDKTGWYYYNKLLPGQTSTESILKSVEFAKNMDNSYRGAIYTITPQMEAIQGEDEAADDEGWDITINSDGTITSGRP